MSEREISYYIHPTHLIDISLSIVQNDALIARASSGKRLRGRTGIVHDVCHNKHRHPHRKHPERPERVEAIVAHLQATGMLKRCTLLPAMEASYEGKI